MSFVREPAFATPSQKKFKMPKRIRRNESSSEADDGDDASRGADADEVADSESEREDGRQEEGMTMEEIHEAAQHEQAAHAPAQSLSKPTVMDLTKDAKEEHSAKRKSRKSMIMYAKYGKIERANGKNFRYTCAIGNCRQYGHNATFAKEHLMSHFGDDDVGEELMGEFKTAFPKERIAVQQSIKKYCTEGAAAVDARPTQAGFQDVLSRFIVTSSLPFSMLDKAVTAELVEYVYRMGEHNMAPKLFSRNYFADKVLLPHVLPRPGAHAGREGRAHHRRPRRCL